MSGDVDALLPKPHTASIQVTTTVDDTARIEKNRTKRTRRLAATAAAAEAEASERHVKRSCGGKLRRASFLYGEAKISI